MSKRTRFCLTGCVVIALPLTVSGLAKVAIFTTNFDAEYYILINYKCVCGALNRHFCQTRVSTSPFFSVVFVRCHFVSVLVRWLGGSFGFFLRWPVRCKIIQMCHQMRWLYFQCVLQCLFKFVFVCIVIERNTSNYIIVCVNFNGLFFLSDLF